VGTAILEYRVRDIIEWQVPSGTRTLKIEEVLYQPEAAGDYHL
jgi:regulator of nucleoside diphosphate kinase